MRTLFLLACLLVHGIAIAQSAEKQEVGLSYTYAELRFVDVDTSGGDGFRLNLSYDLGNNWLIVGGLTKLDFNNNVDSTLLELGGGYVWHYSKDFDLVSTLRFVRSEIDNPGGSFNDNGFALSAGTRGLLAPKFEIRGFVNHINLDDSDTYLDEVRIDDLLKRAPRDLDRARIRKFVSGKTVMVTGAGGSIGSELCRQIAACRPEQIILFEQSEFNLYAIDRELDERHPELKRIPLLGDASHKSSVEPVLLRKRPDIVFHSAAYKHVPMLELNPCEGVLNNVLGLVNTAEAAEAAGVSDFVFISTDKAVRPVSVMGACQRVGELYVQLMGESGRTRFNAVRFGNVLGSSGSVVPKFADLIRRGMPIPITDPNVSRYFMLASEAAQLVLQAGSLGRSGDIFVLDMGEPVFIEELARDLALLMGAARNGSPEVEIVYTGLRPGEKLEEELRIEPTEDRPTGFGSILVEGYRSARGWRELEIGLESLIEAARAGEAAGTVRALRDLVPEYRPATPKYAELLEEAPETA